MRAFRISFVFLFLTSFGLAAFLVPPMTAQAAEGYAGSAKCQECHKDIYAAVSLSGHPYKLQKIMNGKPPKYPPGTSPGVPNPPKGMTWNDVSYVIGGYGWKARFMDLEGYVLTGKTDRQYNLTNETLGLKAGWTGYSAKDAPRKPYTCGSCHTTGWVETGKEGPHQDGLPGIHGTWSEPGVTCEACHGPGAAHVAKPKEAKLWVGPNCESCHVRGDVTKIDVSGGMVRHHEQYEDLLASPHRKKGCLACHDPHASAKYGNGFKGQVATCVKCHEEDTKMVVAPEAHSVCIDCHMPFAGKSAVAKTINYKDGEVPKGDIRSHLHRIDDDLNWNMFTDDGKYIRTDRKGRAYLTVDFTCLSCHVTKDKAWAAKNAGSIHGDK